MWCSGTQFGCCALQPCQVTTPARVELDVTTHGFVKSNNVLMLQGGSTNCDPWAIWATVLADAPMHERLTFPFAHNQAVIIEACAAAEICVHPGSRRVARP